MLDCLILGDSIAAGVGTARPACTAVAQVGITSGAFLQTLLPTAPKAATHLVISLGVNDDPTVPTADNLRRLRRAVTAARVTWLLPGLKEPVRQAIRTVAAERGDRVIDTAAEAGPDHLHPGKDGYRRIASWTEQPGPAPSLAPALAPTLAMAPPSAPASSLRRLTPSPIRPSVSTPGSIYGSVAAGPFAAIPPKDYAFRALASSPSPRLGY